MGVEHGSGANAAHAVGERVVAADGARGTVVSVSTVVAPLVVVEWDDNPGEIIYPMNAPQVRKAMPWE